MHDYVDSQHQEHIPIRNSRIAVDRYGIHHHETAYQETDHNGKLGGKIEEIEVSCIEPCSQVMFHLGYEFDENDVHDVKLLCETFHIEVPKEYR